MTWRSEIDGGAGTGGYRYRLLHVDVQALMYNIQDNDNGQQVSYWAAVTNSMAIKEFVFDSRFASLLI